MVGIGFFAPFPLALMVPFMAGQSLAMGEAFGKGFQYGKRKISSMSNEEFNALNFQQLAESIHTDYKMMIPSLEESIKASDRLQDAVFKALADVIKDIPSQILDFFGDIGGTSTNNNNNNTNNVGPPVLTKPDIIPSGAGSGAWFTLGISALMKLWAREGNISYETLAIYEKQYAGAILQAQKNSNMKKLRKLRDEILAKGADERVEQRALEEENKGQGKLYNQLTKHGYISNPTPQLVKGATGKRKQSQSALLEYKKLGQLFWTQYAVASSLMQIILNDQASSGPKRQNLKDVVIPNLNLRMRNWVNFGFTYQYI